MPSSFRSEQSRPVAVWLFAVAFLVFAMLVVGGATRLTGSGLSITEWKPVTGAIPPLSDAAWLSEFHKYQRIPQYQFVNRGMTLEAFKSIYWWEWAHRLLGRALGVVFALPFVAFLLLRRLPRRLIWRCVGLFALGGLQGLVGWWMVASGLTERVKVAPERLATHLGLALILMVALIWTGLEAWAGRGRPGPRTGWAMPAALLAVGVYLQCLLGALVAGNDAGLIDNDWPLMGGQVIPRDYVSGGLWETLAHSQAAVQFNHRLLGYVVFAAAAAFAIQALRRRAPEAVRTLSLLLAGLVTLQALLGIATLMNQAPLALAAPHQAGAAIVLAAATVLAWRARRV